jgi:hypothetical protein
MELDFPGMSPEYFDAGLFLGWSFVNGAFLIESFAV